MEPVQTPPQEYPWQDRVLVRVCSPQYGGVDQEPYVQPLQTPSCTQHWWGKASHDISPQKKKRRSKQASTKQQLVSYLHIAILIYCSSGTRATTRCRRRYNKCFRPGTSPTCHRATAKNAVAEDAVDRAALWNKREDKIGTCTIRYYM